jgi:hypothetical protein
VLCLLRTVLCVSVAFAAHDAVALGAGSSVSAPGVPLTFSCSLPGRYLGETSRGPVPPETQPSQVRAGWPVDCAVAPAWCHKGGLRA